jgi:hypothetical protein
MNKNVKHWNQEMASYEDTQISIISHVERKIFTEDVMGYVNKYRSQIINDNKI